MKNGLDMNRLIDNNTEIFNDTMPAKEKNVKVVFNCSGHEFYKIKVDSDRFNNLIGNNEPRCDYAIVKVSRDIELLIELKGQDIQRACKQLQATKRLLLNNHDNVFGAIAFRSNPAPTKLQISLKGLKDNAHFKGVFYHKNKLELIYIPDDNTIKKTN
jgi:hypothetical protein